jgi:hypothetical protein
MKVQLFAGAERDMTGVAPFSEIHLSVETSMDPQESARRLAAALCKKWGCTCVIRAGDDPT